MSRLQSHSRSTSSRSSSPEQAKGSSAHASDAKPRRTRASNTKVKTGCLTCKRRRKKCDEGRPSCNICITKGYKCDGYESVLTKKGAKIAPELSPIALTPNDSPSLLAPSSLPSFTAEEQRYFDIFCKYTIPQLAGGFESTFWQAYIPRASYSIPCIRHAAVSLAAIHEDFAHGRKIAVDAQPDCTLADTDFTMAQYGLAIQSLLKLVQDTGEGSTEIVLSVCVLFICLELLRGNHNAVLMHTQSGMNVLTDSVKKSRPSSTKIESFIPLCAIVPVFTRLDVQASDIINAAPPGHFGKLTTPLTPSPVPSTFQDLEHSKQCLLEYQSFFMFKAQETIHVYGIDPSNWPRTNRERLLRMQSEYQSVLAAWSQTHLQLIERQALEKDPKAARAADILIIHHCFLSIALKRFPGRSEMVFDQCTPLFEEIISIAERIISQIPPDHGENTLSLSFDLGVAEPLFYVVTRCRVPQLRRRALGLLRKCSGSEGIWNSSLAACLGEMIIDIEERASPAWPNVASEKDVPCTARVFQLRPKITLGKGDLVVAFRDYYDNVRERKVNWTGSPGDKLLAARSRAEWPLGTYQPGVKNRLRLNMNTVKRHSSAPQSVLQSEPVTTPGLDQSTGPTTALPIHTSNLDPMSVDATAFVQTRPDSTANDSGLTFQGPPQPASDLPILSIDNFAFPESLSLSPGQMPTNPWLFALPLPEKADISNMPNMYAFPPAQAPVVDRVANRSAKFRGGRVPMKHMCRVRFVKGTLLTGGTL